MTIKISSAIYDSNTPATKQLFEGASGENIFYGRNAVDWVAFANASGVTDASFKALNITTGDVFVLNGIDATTVKAKIVGNSVVLTAGSQTYTFGAIAGGESFTVKFASNGTDIDSKELAIARTASNAELVITSTYSTDSAITLTSGDLYVAPIVPQFTLAADTGISGDSITSNDSVSVSGLKSDLTAWEYTLNATATSPTWTSVSKTSGVTSGAFTLTEKTHSVDDIKVRQTYNSQEVQSLANTTAIVIDKTAPVVANSNPIAAVTDKITLTFSEPVSTSLAIGDITANNSHSLGSATLAAVSSSNGYATSFEITRDPAASLAAGDTLTVASTKAVDKVGNTSAAITFTVPTLPDIKPPTMASAVIDSTGLSVVITYSEALSGTPEAGDYAITLGSGTTTVSNAAISGSAVTLTLANPIGVGVTVSQIAYTASAGTATNSIKDLATNAAADQNLLTANITNSSTADVTPPVLSSATVNGTALALTFTSDSLSSTTAATTAFAVTNGGNANAVTNIAVDDATKKITLTLTNLVINGETVTLGYTDPTANNDANAIQDTAGNDAASFSDSNVTNLTPSPDTTKPVISDARITGSSLVLTLTELNALSGTPLESDFVIKVNNVVAAKTISFNSANKTVTFTLSDNVPTLGTETVTIDYTEPDTTSQRIADAAGNDLVGFSRNVSNATVHTLTTTVNSASFIERATDGSHYVKLVGTGFSQLLDIGKGEIASATTDVIGRLDFTSNKIVWNTVSASATTQTALTNSVSSVSHVYLVSDTEMRVVLSDTLWTLLASTSLLGAGDATQDNVAISAGFLKDFAGNTNTAALSTTAGTFTLDEYHQIVNVSSTSVSPDAPTIYSSVIYLSGEGYFSGANIKTNGGITVDGLTVNKTLTLSNLSTLAGGNTLTNANNFGEVIVNMGSVDGVVAPATNPDNSTSTGTTSVVFTNNDPNIYQFFTLGDGIDKFVLASKTGQPQISGGTFDVTKDKILLDATIFTGITTAATTSGTVTASAAISASQFEVAGAATTASIRLFFDTNGDLYYDSDGNTSSGVAAVKILAIGTPSSTLTDTNFGLINNTVAP